MNLKNKRFVFWLIDNKTNIKISQSKLIEFLANSGFYKAKISNTKFLLVYEKENRVSEIEDTVVIDYVSKYLKEIGNTKIIEEFSKGVSSYINKTKLKLLPKTELINDRDIEKNSYFFFKNICCQVGDNKIKEIKYENFKNKIWESRVLENEYDSKQLTKSQFEKFCYNLSGKNDVRYLALQTNIGYLLHRNNDSKNSRALIFIDENISYDGTANGGTGKSLLLQAIGKCRELVVVDGKNLKSKSWFKNQRIKLTTDIIFYDDVNRDFSLEELYSMITTGITVDKKYKDEIYIKPENAPKIAISSNYIVKGTGGNTDTRRRCEFEVANHYNGDNTPFDEFNCTFFDDWDIQEWSSFYYFMMNCVLKYFEHGLIIAKPINLKRNKLISLTNHEFVRFIETGIVEVEKWISKKVVLELFISEYQHYNNISSHRFTKWMKSYAKDKDLIYEDRKSENKYEFYLKPKFM
ncbi:DUF5906 domain-containing protein [uncultured Tenacibaculum sp.]|uniref:DUF5906 domain-containing protein n=1 Tax=uncultured Tenacibaculum sp. TaxID=174713 RepID=UPI002629977C|nr:DUF5906 domain-containing protein [uncultured Tenacibaculum sp.]